MLTYLLIFFSFVLIVGIFLRRYFLLKKQKIFANKPKPAKEISEIEEIDLSKSQQLKVEDFFKEGENFLKNGDEEEAIKSFVKVLAIDPYNIETTNRLAVLYMERKMYAAAGVLFRQLAEITGEAVHFSHLGLALFNQNILAESLKAYQQAVNLDPSRPGRFVSMAQVYKALGLLNNAIIALNKAIDLDDKNMEYLLLLAELFILAGDKESALKIVRNILDIEPFNDLARQILQKIYQVPKDPEEPPVNNFSGTAL